VKIVLAKSKEVVLKKKSSDAEVTNNDEHLLINTVERVGYA
jgi:hypothetical protein